jgi:hypothetical protein
MKTAFTSGFCFSIAGTEKLTGPPPKGCAGDFGRRSRARHHACAVPDAISKRLPCCSVGGAAFGQAELDPSFVAFLIGLRPALSGPVTPWAVTGARIRVIGMLTAVRTDVAWAFGAEGP